MQTHQQSSLYAEPPGSNPNLYVLNLGNSTVTVYAKNGTKVLRTISQGMHNPNALLFGSAGYLYVANGGNSTVTEYAPGSTKVLRTISQGLNLPIALVFGP